MNKLQRITLRENVQATWVTLPTWSKNVAKAGIGKISFHRKSLKLDPEGKLLKSIVRIMISMNHKSGKIREHQSFLRVTCCSWNRIPWKITVFCFGTVVGLKIWVLYREHRKKSQRPTWRFLSKSKPPVTPLPSAPPKEKRKVEAFRTPFLPVESETSVENETPSRLGFLGLEQYTTEL